MGPYRLRRRLALCATLLLAVALHGREPARTGVDVLAARSFDLLRRGREHTRVGVLTNHTGIDSRGRRTIDLLAGAPGIKLVAIFSPEHGPTGALDTVEIVDTRDAATGLRVHSVYGRSDRERRPRAEVLRQLDAVVIDLQDAGAAFYTYATTMAYFLEAAAPLGIEVFVLDRPNPVGGTHVQGPLSDAGHLSFTRYHPLPVRHGMTIGELALLFNSERKIGAKLTIVPMEGWRRADWFDATGLRWVNPSPNLRSLTSATLYSGVALVEGANVSVGRGTASPFEIIGAPWIDGRDLAAFLNRRRIAGVSFIPVQFTPEASNFAGELCSGVRIVVRNRERLDAPLLGIELAAALARLYPREFNLERIKGHIANRESFAAMQAGENPRAIVRRWRAPLKKFRERRRRFLLYK